MALTSDLTRHKCPSQHASREESKGKPFLEENAPFYFNVANLCRPRMPNKEIEMLKEEHNENADLVLIDELSLRGKARPSRMLALCTWHKRGGKVWSRHLMRSSTESVPEHLGMHGPTLEPEYRNLEEPSTRMFDALNTPRRDFEANMMKLVEAEDVKRSHELVDAVA